MALPLRPPRHIKQLYRTKQYKNSARTIYTAYSIDYTHPNENGIKRNRQTSAVKAFPNI